MGFKFLLKFLLVIMLLTHCGLRTGDSYEEATLRDTQLGCLDEIDQTLQDYISQKIPPEEIGEIAQCLQSAVHIFKNHVWGEEVDTYSPEELRRFLQDFLIKEKTIPDDFLNSLMNLKVGLVGGSNKLLTSLELDEISERIGLLGKFISDIYPYVGVLYNPLTSNHQRLQKNILGIKNYLPDVSHKLFVGSYSLNSALKLLEQSNEIFQFSDDQNLVWFRVFKNTVPFMLNKPSSTDVIEAHEWSSLLEMTMDVLSVYLNKFHGDQDRVFEDKIQYYSSVIDGGFNFLHKKISSSPEKSLNTEELIQLVNALDKDQALPQGIKKDYIQDFFNDLFIKFIENPESQDFSLDLSELQWWRDFYHSWKESQRSIDELQAWLKNNKQYSIDDLDAQVVGDQPFYSSLDKIKQLHKRKPLYIENDFGYSNVHYLYPSRESHGFRYRNVSINNIYTYLVKIIMDRYAHQYPEKGLTEQEFGRFVQDFDILSHFIRGESPSVSSTKQHGRIEFIMSNILLYSTQGYYKRDYAIENDETIDLLSVEEGVELLPVYLQVKKSARDLFQFLNQNCSRLDLSCFENNIFKYISTRMSYTPHLQDFISQSSLEYLDLITRPVRLGGPVQVIEERHLEFVFYSIFFQEVMVTRFDHDEDGILTHEEAMGDAFLLWEGLVRYGAKYVMCLPEDPSDENIKFAYFYAVSELDLMDRRSFQGKFGIAWSYFLYHLGNEVQLNRKDVMELAVNLSQGVVRRNMMGKSCSE